MITFAQLSAEARATLDDAAKATWSDADLLLCANAAIRAICNDFPESRIKTDLSGRYAVDDLLFASAEGSTPLDGVYRPALVHGTVMAAFEQDMGDKLDQSRAAHFAARAAESTAPRRDT